MLLEGFLERHAIAGLAASAEALFPSNDYGAPDYRDTDLVARTIDYWRLLPRRQARLVLLLFAVVELAAPLFVTRWRRFSRLPVERREEAVRTLRASRWLAVRILGDALKATLTLLYMSHPAALRYVGAPVRHEEPPP